MKTRSGSSLLMRCIATIVIFALTFSARSARMVSEHDRLRNGTIDAQILCRVEPLCRILLPDADRLSISMDRTRVYALSGAAEHKCAVACRDSRSGRSVYLEWDVDRSALRGISQDWPRSGAPQAAPFGRQEFLRVSRQWLRVVGIASQ